MKRSTGSPAWTGLLGLLVVAAAVYGLVVDGAYAGVDPLVEQTWRAQDLVTLAVLPLLVVAVRRAGGGSLPGHLAGLGLLMWLAYCYAHLAVAVPFNDVFLVYVAILAMAGFRLLDGLVRLDAAAVASAFDRAPRRAAAWFLAVAGLGIAVLWLSDIAAGLAGGTPANLHLGGLPNPTWVLDLAWLIPMSLGAAVTLRRGRPGGPPIAAALLVMLLVLSVAMLAVTPFALAAGLGDDPSMSSQLVAFTVVFAVLGTVETWLLVRGRRRFGPVPEPWLRPGWWPVADQHPRRSPSVSAPQEVASSSSRRS